jgi:hypothetical protein
VIKGQLHKYGKDNRPIPLHLDWKAVEKSGGITLSTELRSRLCWLVAGMSDPLGTGLIPGWVTKKKHSQTKPQVQDVVTGYLRLAQSVEAIQDAAGRLWGVMGVRGSEVAVQARLVMRTYSPWLLEKDRFLRLKKVVSTFRDNAEEADRRLQDLRTGRKRYPEFNDFISAAYDLFVGAGGKDSLSANQGRQEGKSVDFVEALSTQVLPWFPQEHFPPPTFLRGRIGEEIRKHRRKRRRQSLPERPIATGFAKS